MDNHLAQEAIPTSAPPAGFPQEETVTVDLCSSDDSDIDENAKRFENGGSAGRRYNSRNPNGAKRARHSSEVHMKNVKKVAEGVTSPEGFGHSVPPRNVLGHAIPAPPLAFLGPMSSPTSSGRTGSCKQFWRAGDYEGAPAGNWKQSLEGFDHVRVHPKFLHSNATSHKWALGAFAELLDNALDEVASGATHVNVDMLQNTKAGGNRMLLIEDNGGGMDPEKMRQCMSLGYSAKSKLANTIGQYGNGFKTSTMRLGADVIVFARCPRKDGTSSTQSIGLLSYTFLRSTGQEDIIVPMLDYERKGSEWSKMLRFSSDDWYNNMKTILQWSPFSSEEDLLGQFDSMNDHGTRIIIYNLWEDDQGMLELDFDSDPRDIQLRGVNRDEKNIKMASQFPNSRHFLTYKHSLRSYVSILYLRIPPGFRIILRGTDVAHHNVVNDMMQAEKLTYRPQYVADGFADNSAIVTLGFVKDAGHHIDVQGFNVYHKNRLIKPFWRIWNAAGSEGRGVIGVLEANFVEPAHDKQGFERTTVLARLETRLVQMQKTYWSLNCHKIGYAPRRNKVSVTAHDHRETSPDNDPDRVDRFGKKASSPRITNSSRVGASSYSTSDKDGERLLREELHRERARRRALEDELKAARKKIEEMSKEQENLVDIFSEERERRDGEEESLRTKLEGASNTIQELLDKIKKLEETKGPSWRH